MSIRNIEYKTHGTCAYLITVGVDENDVIQSVEFHGGCDGNHKGIAALCVGMKACDVAKRLSGITCGFKNTSCPDQLAKALMGEKR